MARRNGPIKGTIVLVCNATAESTVVITEPIAATHAQWLALEGGTAEVTCAAIATDLTDHTYYDFAITTSGSHTTTGARKDGPGVKGSLVFVNTTDAISTEYIIEPVVVSKVNFDALLAGTKGIKATMFTDTLGFSFFEGEVI